MPGKRPDVRPPATGAAGAIAEWTIISDDLTGASDAAAPFSRQTNPTVLVDHNHSWSDAQIISINTESRYLDPSAAASAVESVVDSLLRQGRRQFYKKIDSQLRGNVGHEVAAALKALARNGQPAFALVAPAFPAAGRTTVDGNVLVDGDADPEGTNRGSIVESLRRGGLRAAVIRRNEHGSGQALAERISSLASAGYYDAAVVDCTTDGDLATVATAYGLVGFPTLLVGSGGLAAGMANSKPGAASPPFSLPDGQGNALVVIGSYSGRSRHQLEDLTSSGVRHVRLDHSDLSSIRLSGEVLEALRSGHVVLTPDPQAPVEKQRAPEIAEALGRVVRTVSSATRILVLCGGETARAALDSLDIPLMHIAGELQPGVVVHRIPSRDLLIVTKAGAFGDRHTITNVLERMTPGYSLSKGDKQ